MRLPDKFDARSPSPRVLGHCRERGIAPSYFSSSRASSPIHKCAQAHPVWDGEIVGDKLSKARAHGTRILAPREFDEFLANLQPSLGTAPPAPSPVGRSKKAESTREQHVSADERPPTPPPHSAPKPADVREWALENGTSVAERGRLSASLVERYLAAQEQASPPAQ